jgi:hypothetical protein
MVGMLEGIMAATIQGHGGASCEDRRPTVSSVHTVPVCRSDYLFRLGSLWVELR